MKEPHAIAALERKKNELLSEMERHLEAVAEIRAKIKHLDETARMLDPDATLKDARASRRYTRIFAKGELVKAISEIFKTAGHPLSINEVTKRVQASFKLDVDISQSVRGSIQNMASNGMLRVADRKNREHFYEIAPPPAPDGSEKPAPALAIVRGGS